MRPYDGSAAIYTAWLVALRQLGFGVTVISFNQALLRWTDVDLTALSAKAESVLILDAYRSKVDAAFVKMERLAWAVLGGRRYARHIFGRRHAEANIQRISDFLATRHFEVIVVNKTTSIRLIGRALDRLSGQKLLDIHDSLPRRATLTRSVGRRLLRSHAEVARLMKIEDVGDMLSWATEERLLREEVRSISGFNSVLFPDADEVHAFVSAGLDPATAQVIPWPMLDIEHVPDSKGCGPTNEFHVGFLGSAQLFNFEAVAFLVREVLPRLRREHPKLRVLVAGSIGPAAGQILRVAPVEVVPWVEHIADFYRKVDVVVVPLLSGTGVSVKTIEAAAHGSAIVTTQVGLRGLSFRDEQEVLVAEGGVRFAAAVSRLLNDPSLRARLGAAAVESVARHHSLAAFCRATKTLLSDGGQPSEKANALPRETPGANVSRIGT
jgi:glycosyltransferase involved in cell wall biosynthesis